MPDCSVMMATLLLRSEKNRVPGGGGGQLTIDGKWVLSSRSKTVNGEQLYPGSSGYLSTVSSHTSQLVSSVWEILARTHQRRNGECRV